MSKSVSRRKEYNSKTNFTIKMLKIELFSFKLNNEHILGFNIFMSKDSIINH